MVFKDLLNGSISFKFALGVLIQVCSLLVAGMGLIVLLGWFLGFPYLSSLGAGIPVAPSTAVLFVLYSLAIILLVRSPSNPTVYKLGVIINLAGGLVALALLILSYQGIYLDIEHMGISHIHVAGEIPIGHMSPLTAACFLLASLSYLLLIFSLKRSAYTDGAWWLAALLTGIGSLLLLAYLLGVPVLYGSSFIPPAALTSVALSALGVALMGLAVPYIWWVRDANSLSIRAGYSYILTFILLAAGISVIGYVSYKNFEEGFHHQAEQQISTVAELKVNELLIWKKERLADANFVYENPVFSNLVGRFLDNPRDAEAEEQIRNWLNEYEAIDQYDRVRLLNIQGVPIIDTSVGMPSPNLIVLQKIPEVLQSRRITFVDFYRSEQDRHIFLSILIPILDENQSGRVLGFVAVRIDPEVYLYPYLVQWPIKSNTAETLLVRQDGKDVLFLNDIRFNSNAALTLRFPLTKTSLLAVKAVLGQTGVVEGTDYRDHLVLADIRPVLDSPWFMVTKMDTGEIYEPLRTRLWQTVGMIALGIFAAGALLITIWRQQRILFYRTQAANAIALSESDERFKSAFEYSAIGMALISPQGQWLKVNPKVCEILGYSEEELLAKTFQEITHPDDLSADLKQVRQMLVGEIETYTMEKRYFHKNGRIVWVLLAVSLVKDNNNTSLYFISQIEDITERKQAEEALRMKSFSVDNAFDALFWITPDARIVDVNAAACRTLGYTRDELLQLRVPDVDTHYNAEIWITHFSELRQAGSLTFESEQRAKDGRLFPVEIVANYVQLGTEERNCAFVRDITERKQAEEILRESESRYQLVFENSGTANSIFDAQCRLVLQNNLSAQSLGTKPGEALGKTAVEIFGPERGPLVTERMQRVLSSGKAEGFETEFTLPSGKKWFYSAYQPIFDKQHTVIEVQVISQDITARRQAEEALRESEERYRTVVSNAPVVTFVTDENGIFTLSEGKGLAKLGLQPGQVVGLSLFDVYKDHPSILDAMKSALAGNSLRREINVQGTVFDVFFSPVFDAQGNVIKVIGVSNDVSERKQAENKIRQLNAELEQRVRERTAQLETANKELEAFSYSVSHDLRAPLRGIDGWSQALLEDYHDKFDEQGQQYINRVRSETQRMGQLIDDMLKLSRLTRSEMAKEHVDLSFLAENVIEQLKRNEPERKVDFSIQAGLTAKCDSHLLEAVLANLLGNAFKFTARRADARIEFGEIELDGRRVFFVRDNGAGFDMAYSQKLFGAFQRMHKVSEFPGTGIGLATVQRVIHRHGGRVWVEAEVDHGATFYFTLE